MAEIFKNATGDTVKPGSLKDDQAIVGSFGDDKAIVEKVKGKVRSLSAVCTHQGCVVGFNSKEKTFDCPCHGSRFKMDGKVLRGPAVKPLGKYEVEVTKKDIELKD